MSSSVHIGRVGAFMLVLLRIAIGWHFLYEGLWKYNNPGFSSAGFIGQARGPVAEKFLALIPDRDGKQRLDGVAMSERWDDLRRHFADHYKFSDEQAATSLKIYDRRVAQLQAFLNQNAEEIKEYFAGLDKLHQTRATDPTADSVPFQQKRLHEQENTLRSQATPWLGEVDRLDAEYRQELAGLLDADQQRRPAYPEPKSSVDKIDLLTTYGLIAIGVCLIAGLLTRLAAAAGGVFLLLVFATQIPLPNSFPPLPPSAGHSLVVNKEFIEMLTLFALATLPVGRWGGLDFILHSLLFRPRKDAQ